MKWFLDNKKLDQYNLQFLKRTKKWVRQIFWVSFAIMACQFRKGFYLFLFGKSNSCGAAFGNAGLKLFGQLWPYGKLESSADIRPIRGRSDLTSDTAGPVHSPTATAFVSMVWDVKPKIKTQILVLKLNRNPRIRICSLLLREAKPAQSCALVGEGYHL